MFQIKEQSQLQFQDYIQQNNQQNYQRRNQRRDSDSGSEGSSDRSRSSSSDSVFSQRNYRPRDAKYRSKQDGYDSSSNSDSSAGQEFAHTHQGAQSQLTAGQKVKASVAKDSGPEPIETLEQMKKIILKRTQLENLLENLYFADYVENCFVRYTLGNGQGQYSIGEIIDVKEAKDEYQLERLKTNKRLAIRDSDRTFFLKMILVSNSSPNEDEFQTLLKKRKHFRHPTLTNETIQFKLNRMKQIENMNRNQDELNSMVEKKFELRMEKEKLQGFNLSIYKVELQNDIGHLKRKLHDLY